jgi:G3E family GTPase
MHSLHTYKSGDELEVCIMKKEKATSKEPLLYIQQPKLQEVKGNMQVTYRSAKPIEKKVNVPNQSIELDLKKHRDAENRNEKTDHKEKSEDTPKNEKEDQMSAASTFRRLKPFKELNLEEKLEYISASINGKVPFPCEFSTETVSYKGVLSINNEHEIKLKTFQGEEVTIAKESLKSIKMIGLH